jgi:C1A family cysteine protease
MSRLLFITILLSLLNLNDCRYAEWEEVKPYCAIRPNPQCCTSRDDDCFMPYYDSRCYCDTFCFRGIDNHDCCPDHDAVCEGKQYPPPAPEPQRPPPPPPPPLQTGNCYDTTTGRQYSLGESFSRDCNLCRCITLGYQTTLSCEEDLCVNSPDLLSYVNNQQPYLGWRATTYDKFNGVKVKDALKHYLGTIPDRSLRAMVDNAPDDPTEYFRMDEVNSFDARTHQNFAGKIRGIRDQGKCGVSWALSTVDVASDRLSLVQNIRWKNEPLSVQNVLSCTDKDAKDNCDGGRVAYAWGFIKDRGVVTEDCYPYESGKTGNITECKLHLSDSELQNIAQHRKVTNIRCPSNMNGEHFNFGPAYRVRDEARSIKYELHFRGPVQATMRVTPEFFLYQSGVYRCGGSSYDHQNPRYANLAAYHSIRLLGWGTSTDPRTQQEEHYWIAANSWGTGWGENGYFHIRFGECEVEETIIATYGKSTEVLKQKNKRQ